MSTSSQLTTHAYLSVQKSLSSGLDSVQLVVSHFPLSYQTANSVPKADKPAPFTTLIPCVQVLAVKSEGSI